jgi:hypothetical protein
MVKDAFGRTKNTSFKMFLFNVCADFMNKLEPPPKAIKGITPQVMQKKTAQEEELARHAAEMEKRTKTQQAEEEMQKSFQRFDEQQARLETTAMEHKRYVKQFVDKYRPMKDSDPEKKKYQQMAKNRLEMYNRTMEQLKVLEVSRHKLTQIHHGVLTSQQNKETEAAIRSATDALKLVMNGVSASSIDQTFTESQMLLEQASEISHANSQQFIIADGAWAGDAALEEQLDELLASEDIAITQVDYAPDFSATAAAAVTLPSPPTRSPAQKGHRRTDTVQIKRTEVALLK